MLVELVNLGGLELPGWHIFGEEDIEFVEGAVLGLWQSEVRPDKD